MSTAEPFWAVARTQSKREDFAAERLAIEGFETFLPLIVGRGATMPLFSGYLFVAVNGQPWQPIRRTPGVLALIQFGDQPARCPDREVDALRARADDQGIIRLPPPPAKRRHAYAAGDPVRIVGGPFSGLSAIHSGMTAGQREIVLIGLLGAARKVAIAARPVFPQ